MADHAGGPVRPDESLAVIMGRKTGTVEAQQYRAVRSPGRMPPDNRANVC